MGSRASWTEGPPARGGPGGIVLGWRGGFESVPGGMRGPGVDGEGELRGQLANPGSPGKTAVKTVCVCVDGM